MGVTEKMYLLAKEIVKEYESNIINIKVNDPKQISLIDEIEEKENRKHFSEEVENCLTSCLKHFELHLLPDDKEIIDWKDTIDKLNRLDKIPFDKIVEIVQWARNDKFWKPNFLSLLKLRRKNKEKKKYIVVFSEQMKSSNASKIEGTMSAMYSMLQKNQTY